MTRFYRRWLTVWCFGVGLFGLVLYGAGFDATTAPAAAIFALMGNPLPVEPDRYLRFAVALMGAVTAGWAVTYYAAFRAAWNAPRADASKLWRLLTAGALMWFAIDSLASIANGFPLNALSNTALLIGYLVPVIASRALAGKSH